MGIFDLFRRGRFGKATALVHLPEFLMARESRSGVRVNVDTALSVATVFGCARVIAEGLAQVPVRFYQRNGDKPATRIFDHPLEELLTRRPNRWQTAFEFIETLVLHLALTGNAFVWINSVGRERKIVELIPIEPGKVIINRDPATLALTYQVTMENGRSPVMTAGQIWHLRGPSWNSWRGLDAIKLAREAIGLALATEESHAQFHRNGARPSGGISVEGTLDGDQYTRLRTYLEENFAGAQNAGRPMIMDRSAKWQPFMMSGVDAQHIETRKHQIEEICRFMRVIPMMVMHTDKTATYASAEQMFIAHVVHTIQPWAVRFEQSAESALTRPEDRLDIRFNLKGLMRGAAKDRAEYNAKALGSGGSPAWMTQNEVRDEDGLDWIEGGDELPKPTNVAPPAPPSGDPSNDN